MEGAIVGPSHLILEKTSALQHLGPMCVLSWRGRVKLFLYVLPKVLRHVLASLPFWTGKCPQPQGHQDGKTASQKLGAGGRQEITFMIPMTWKVSSWQSSHTGALGSPLTFALCSANLHLSDRAWDWSFEYDVWSCSLEGVLTPPKLSRANLCSLTGRGQALLLETLGTGE